MRYFLKRYYRDSVTGVMLTLSLTLIMFMGFNGIRLLGALLDGEKRWHAGEYAHTYIFGVKLEPRKPLEENPHLLEEMADSRQGVSLEMGFHAEGSMEFVSVMLLLNRGKEEDYPLISGDRRLEEKDGVWIGRSQMRNTRIRDGKRYIGIQSQGEYPVKGLLVTQSASGYDDRIIVSYKTMSAEKKELWSQAVKWGFTLFVAGDDDEEVRAECGRLLELLDKIGYATEEKRDYEDSIEMAYRYLARLLLPLFMSFCIGNSFVVVRLWMMRKKREIAICKSMGAGTPFQLRRLLWEFFKCLLPSAVLGLLLELAYSAWEGRSVNPGVYVNAWGGGILLGLLAVLAGNLLLYAKFIRRVPPATGMKAK